MVGATEVKSLVKMDASELSAIEPSRAEQIRLTFAPMAEMLSEFEEAYNEVIEESNIGITTEVTAKAKRLRLDIAKVRIETDKIRKAEKEKYLRAGKAIDGVSNILKWAVEDKEKSLKGIENHFENIERERLMRLQESRVMELEPYVEDASERNLAAMEDDVWNAYFAAKVKEHEDRIATEKRAEEERIAKEKADAEERERIKKENAKLKAEADKRAAEDAERQAKEKAIRDAEASKLKKEKERRLAAERELAERQEQERLEAQRKLDEEQAELSKGDKDRVGDLVADLEDLKSKYVFRSKKNKKMYEDVGLLLDKIITHIQK